MYENTNRHKAIRATIEAMTVIVCRMFVFPSSGDVSSLPLNAAATFPITSEIEGRIAPARTEARVPKPSRHLSSVLRYIKNLESGIYRGSMG